MKHRVILSLTLAVVLTLTVQANDWPKFRGPNGDNTVPEAKIAKSFPAEGPKIAWRMDANPGYGGAAIVEDEVFLIDRVLGEKDVLHCLKLDDGTELWRWELEVPGRISHPGSRVVPTVTADTVYASSGFGHVYAIDRASRTERWVVDVAQVFGAQPPRFGYSVHPVVHGDKLIIAPTGDDVGMAALNKADGSVIWRGEPVSASHSSPVLVELLGREVVFMPGSNRGEQKVYLVGCDPDTGRTLVKFTGEIARGIHNNIPNVTVIDEDTLFFTGGYGQGSWVLDFASGADGTMTVSGSRKIEACSLIHPGLKVGDQLYMTAEQQRGNDSAPTGLVCMDLTGEVLWSTGRDPQFNNGSLILAGDTLVVQDGDSGLLRLIEPGPQYKLLAEGKVFSKPTGDELWAPLALGSGRLIMRTQNEIVCVDLRL